MAMWWVVFLCSVVCVVSGVRPPPVIPPWEGPNAEAFLREYKEQAGVDFRLHSDATPTEIWPKPVSYSHGSKFYLINPSQVTFSFIGAGGTGEESSAMLKRFTDRYKGLIFLWDAANPSEARARQGQDTEGSISEIVLNVTISDTKLGPDTNDSYIIRVEDTNSVRRGQGEKHGADNQDSDPVRADSNGIIFIESLNVYGALRGLETLSQSVGYNFTSKEYSVRQMLVEDYPRFPFRGAMVDASRNFMEIGSLRDMIDIMSYFKMNALHLHLSDDQSWPLIIDKFPLLSKFGAFSNFSHTYTLDDMKWLVAYAKDRGVRIIPEIDMPSHSGKICNAYPDVCSHWLSGGGHILVNLLDPTNEDMWKFLTDVYTELASVFEDEEYHIGGDEVWTVPWQNSSRVQDWNKKYADGCPDDPTLTCGGISGLHHYFTRRVISILSQLGKSAIGWAPGIDNYDVGDSGSSDYSNYTHVTMDVWSGFSPPGSQYWQHSMGSYTQQSSHVILSGPFYAIDRWPHINDGSRFSWHDMYHTDPQNFTGSPEQYSLVRGGKLCVWDDAARTDSGNLAHKTGIFLAAMSEQLWSLNGTVIPRTFPDDHVAGGRLLQHRCRIMRRGFTFEPMEVIARPCPIEYQPPAKPLAQGPASLATPPSRASPNAAPSSLAPSRGVSSSLLP